MKEWEEGYFLRCVVVPCSGSILLALYTPKCLFEPSNY